MSSRSKLLRTLATTLAIGFALSCLSTAHAQSGRRAPGSKSVPTPTAEPDPMPAPASSRQTSQPILKFILGVDRYDSFTNVSLSSISGVRRNCAQRLSEPGWIKVDSTERDMSRSDAIKLAKAEKGSYVVWLRVRDDGMSGKQSGTSDNLYIEYAVFAPLTAKIVTSGSTYPRNRNSVIPGRPTSTMEGDYYLNRAAREAADRILTKFSLHAPRRP